MVRWGIQLQACFKYQSLKGEQLVDEELVQVNNAAWQLAEDTAAHFYMSRNERQTFKNERFEDYVIRKGLGQSSKTIVINPEDDPELRTREKEQDIQGKDMAPMSAMLSKESLEVLKAARQ
jgi:transcription elongation factor